MKKKLTSLFYLILIIAYTADSFAQTKSIADSITDTFKFKISSPFPWCDFYTDIDFKPEIKDNKVIFISKHDNPIIIYTMGGLKREYIFVAPQDTIYTTINKEESKYKLVLHGKDSLNTQFLKSFDAEFPYRNNPKYIVSDSSNIMDYKKLVDDKTNEMRSFLSNAKQQGLISEPLFNFYSTEITFRYYSQLYSPIWEQLVNTDSIPRGYVDDLIISPTQIETPAYLSFLVKKNGLDKKITSTKDIYNICVNIMSNNTSQEQEFLTSYLIGKLSDMLNERYKDIFVEILDQTKSFKNSDYIEYIDKAQEYYLKDRSYFTDDILNNTFLSSFEEPNTPISLKNVLDKHMNQPLYMDFWASWCGPCRYDIEVSAESKQFLRDNEIEVIYFSIDTDKDQWLKASEEDDIKKNQYIVLNYKQSPLYDFLQLTSIPRGVILNNEHKIKHYKAPRLGETHLDELKNAIGETQKTAGD